MTLITAELQIVLSEIEAYSDIRKGWIELTLLSRLGDPEEVVIHYLTNAGVMYSVAEYLVKFIRPEYAKDSNYSFFNL
jgi:hypothetical protein